MENETFTFVTCSHLGHCVEYRYLTRGEADNLFDKMVDELSPVTGLFVAYYCASTGGLVNAHYVP